MSKLCNGGVATVNECREQLGLPDVDGGDSLRIPVNVAPLDRWIDGQTGQQQLAHPDVAPNPQPEAGYTRPLRAV